MVPSMKQNLIRAKIASDQRDAWMSRAHHLLHEGQPRQGDIAAEIGWHWGMQAMAPHFVHDIIQGSRPALNDRNRRFA